MIFYSVLIWSLPCNLDTHTVDTNVVNIVSLVEDNDTIPSKFFADNLCNLWIQKIMVAIDHNICLLNGPTSKEVRTPALRQDLSRCWASWQGALRISWRVPSGKLLSDQLVTFQIGPLTSSVGYVLEYKVSNFTAART